MSGGWVKIYRKLLDWGWYGDPNVVALFVHILLTVNHEKREWRGMTIEPGQKVTTVRNLAEESGLTIRQTRTALFKLNSTNEIKLKTTPNFTLIEVKKWKEYQEDNRDFDKRMTNERQTVRQTNDTYIRNKEVRREECKKNKEEIIYIGEPTAPTPKDVMLEFVSDPLKQEELVAFFVSKGLPDQSVKSELRNFINYWTELNPTGTKQRWQMQKTFELKRRLLTWMANVEKFSRMKTNSPKGIEI